jgi:hypothetical protein
LKANRIDMKEQDYLDIEAYLQGELPPVKATALEARAAESETFAAELAQRRMFNDHLRADATETELRATLVSLGANYFPPVTATKPAERPVKAVVRPMKKKRTGRNWFVGLGIAAAITLAMVLGGDFLLPATDGYEQFAQHQSLSLTERGDGDEGVSAVELAYNEGRYDEAIIGLTDYLKRTPTDNRARLALGISLLEASRNDEAVSLLRDLAAKGSSLAPYANWYLALAAVRGDDKAEALRQLNLIPANDAYLAGRVADLREVIALD